MRRSQAPRGNGLKLGILAAAASVGAALLVYAAGLQLNPLSPPALPAGEQAIATDIQVERAEGPPAAPASSGHGPTAGQPSGETGPAGQEAGKAIEEGAKRSSLGSVQPAAGESGGEPGAARPEQPPVEEPPPVVEQPEAAQPLPIELPPGTEPPAAQPPPQRGGGEGDGDEGDGGGQASSGPSAASLKREIRRLEAALEERAEEGAAGIATLEAKVDELETRLEDARGPAKKELRRQLEALEEELREARAHLERDLEALQAQLDALRAELETAEERRERG